MSNRLFPGLTSIAFAAALLVSQTGAASTGGDTVSLPIQDCLAQSGDAAIVACAIKGSLRDVLFFDHRDGRILYPVPAQLEVEDGAVFTIVFLHTDPTNFDYTLKGLSGADDKAANFLNNKDSAETSKNVTAFVTWRHDRHFPLYQAKVSLRQAAKPAEPDQREKDRSRNISTMDTTQAARETTLEPLFEYTFPVWVKTAGWNITFTSGVGFSSLTNKKYFIGKDDGGNKIVKADPNRGDQSRPDVMALANLALPHLKTPGFGWAGEKLGVAFGIGLGGDSDTRYYFGPSYTLGKRFILTGGWTGGKVSTLPVGQRLNEAPINGDNTLGTLGSRFAHGYYLGISFTFTPDKESDFLNALTPPQKTGEGTTAPKGKK